MPAVLLLIAFLAAGHIETGEGRTCSTKMNLLFVPDGSASVCNISDTSLENPPTCESWSSLGRFMANVAYDLNIGYNETRAAVITFGSDVITQFNLLKYTDKADLMRALMNLQYPGGELYGDKIIHGLRVMTEVFNPAMPDECPTNVTNVIFILTDGLPDYAPEETGGSADILKVLGVKVFVICTRSEDCTKNDYARARLMASPTNPPIYNQTYFIVDSYDTIDSIRESVLENICALVENDTPISPSPSYADEVIEAGLEAFEKALNNKE